MVSDLLSREVPSVDVIKVKPNKESWYNKMPDRISQDPLKFPDCGFENSILIKHVIGEYPEVQVKRAVVGKL